MKRNWLIAVWGLGLLGSGLFAQQSQETNRAIEQELARCLEQLEHPIEEIRQQALAKIILLGPQVLPTLLADFPRHSYLGRRMILRALATFAEETTIAFLVKALEDSDYGVRSEATGALLLRLGQAGQESYERARTRLTDPAFANYEYYWLKRELLRFFDERLKRLDAGYGNYEGQYAREASLSKRIAPIMVEILIDSSMHPAVRRMAGEAVGATGNREVIPELQKFFAEEWAHKERNLLGNDDLAEIVAGAIAQLGDPSAIEEILGDYQLRARTRRGAEDFFKLGYTYLRARLYKEAVEAFLQCARSHDKSYASTAYYNIACIYSIQNKRDEAINALEKAVELGYQNKSWMMEDGDLRNAREDPRFRLILDRLP